MSKIFINLLLVLSWQTTTANVTNYRIVGGTPTTINKVKYIVSLRTNGEFFCGGSLVKPQYVVTAAHCVKGMKPNAIKVHGGATYLNQQGVKRSVNKITIPKAFNMRNFTMDVAVLKLSEPMSGNNTATIPLCSHKLSSRELVKVSGWGLKRDHGKKPSRQLRSMIVQTISRKQCRSKYRGVIELTRTEMCASIPGKRDACSGDSGGPLVNRGQLCGIVSYGVGCARKRYPGVYTVINRVKKFINQSTKN